MIRTLILISFLLHLSTSALEPQKHLDCTAHCKDSQETIRSDGRGAVSYHFCDGKYAQFYLEAVTPQLVFGNENSKTATSFRYGIKAKPNLPFQFKNQIVSIDPKSDAPLTYNIDSNIQIQCTNHSKEKVSTNNTPVKITLKSYACMLYCFNENQSLVSKKLLELPVNGSQKMYRGTCFDEKYAINITSDRGVQKSYAAQVWTNKKTNNTAEWNYIDVSKPDEYTSYLLLDLGLLPISGRVSVHSRGFLSCKLIEYDSPSEKNLKELFDSVFKSSFEDLKFSVNSDWNKNIGKQNESKQTDSPVKEITPKQTPPGVSVESSIILSK